MTRVRWFVSADQDHYVEDRDDEDVYEDEMYAGDNTLAETEDDEYESEDDSWWDEGLITLLLVGGVILFLFPEPATSAIGVLLIGVGLIAWIVDAIV